MSSPTPAASSAGATSSMDKMASQSSASEAMQSISSSIASASAALSSESKVAAGSMSLPGFMKYLGIGLAVGSGVLIGASFVFKKKGLLAAQKKYQTQAGESYAYLKSPMWWTGMIMMILGEVLNLIAYAVTSAVLVTPLGALAVVISAILSSIFLKERLTLFGKIGCFLCIVGSTVIALNGPDQHAAGEITEFQKMFVSVGFLVWGGICIAASLGIIFFVAPRYGKKYMLVYITVCSLIGGLSVSTISGIGSAVVLTMQGENQFKHWFLYFLIAFVIITLVTEIIYLNKALELFNTAMVTPTYYVLFTFATLVTSIILFQGLEASAVEIVTIVLGFLTICAGITLLQLSKIDPDDLTDKEGAGIDRNTTLLIRASRSQIGHEKGMATGVEDPGIDSIRGGLGVIGSIVRARSSRRIHASADEYHRMADEHGSTRNGAGGLNTLGKGDLERYELHDRPMVYSSASPPSNTHLTLPTFSTHMPQKRDTAISFASGSEAPHGHHGRRSDTAESGKAFSPTQAGSGGGILLSPTSSSQGKVQHTEEHAQNHVTPYLRNIVETTSTSTKEPDDGSGNTIRVVGPRGRRDEGIAYPHVKQMWNESQDSFSAASSGNVAVAPSPIYPSPGKDFTDMRQHEYVGGDDSTTASDSSRSSSPVIVRRKAGSAGVFSMGGAKHLTKSRHGEGQPNEDDEDEAEELLSPIMRDAQTFANSNARRK